MKVGIIGAGRMAQSIGYLAAQSGYKVVMSNSRGPSSIQQLGEKMGVQVGTVDDVARYGDIIITALHLQHSKNLPRDLLSDKVIINPQNYFPYFGFVKEIENNTITTAEYLYKLLGNHKIVKAFNSITVEDIVPDAREKNAHDRRALPLAGDDEQAKLIVQQFIDEIGYDTVDVGKLSDGWKFERMRPCYCIPLDRSSLIDRLDQTSKSTFVPDGLWLSDRGIKA